MSFDLKNDISKKIHFIGIGGVSMSGLAEILLERGFKVSGSDMNGSPMIDKLKEHGAEIYLGHNEKNINNVDIVVYTAAIPEDNPELIYARKNNISLMTRAEFLGSLMKGHKYNIAISGTHGKTTTTSMVSHIALTEDVDPTILVGGNLDIINGNVLAGKSDYFITEACEYKASFLEFYPYIGVILNIDADHLDYYKNIDDIENTFAKFVNLIPKEGYLIANADDKRVARVASNATCNVVSFGIDNGDIRAKNISFNESGFSSFDVYKSSELLFNIELNVPGKHNILNALSAIASALTLKISHKSIIDGLKSFKGTHRRFEIKGVKNGITVIDDYAHHPTEIKATLDAAKNYPHNKIYCVFQPHTYSRTLSLFDDFSNSFSGVDELVLADIYAAREKDTGVVSSLKLSEAINKNGVKSSNLHSFEDIVNYFKSKLNDGDILLTVGAGDVFKIGEMFLSK
ncbi:UDP-N-acetylmuramate--alanine ligase [Clostridium acetobutylicum]|uniref:UDP-N-acetylmuramate--L-alanine ligase n=1 Tax=Clostridium acetobutylicum (strain ATCC 824 / DSM 792 / JCM 1419 / IAM 19013 / LMG 5710 / NBRC 13948 / NRRL B-527 / VKM B-1787 / 2291 / W) TaxID=272562 RepID=MURC_CLOAB|nr:MULTISPECIES: UDP-N-acetylmuramate--L-alanine ligase [Clostridium]Q97E89.1 RecName: Full=UDP-N-acetylmuramate--L-alanine ligase; AltName: Full=UDP-N-acetylmuramoyl-L-alanine synthetase [Clostridium acetobutylicum ATCC 824]AAK81161.1 UDP-N-acetylmuramate-alanine ligase [Clostridium acetobutylicum ATCC 824]AEI34091.1 UDP-N-acetylmuramate--L-alanine ligase [Clostridium acetobutylicum DSM 1731]AWV81171.1 UDP-N-acetylmuramate--L-alanine ligase [Clostridium acetobutylicum]MBC2395627.1 UDP-N-acety